MNEVIKNICRSLQDEAENVIKYTDRISATSPMVGMGDVEHTFAINRLDAIDHIQNLTLALVNAFLPDNEAAEKGGNSHE